MWQLVKQWHNIMTQRIFWKPSSVKHCLKTITSLRGSDMKELKEKAESDLSIKLNLSIYVICQAQENQK